MKNKLFVWLHKGAGTLFRKAATIAVAWLVDHNFLGGGQDSDLEAQAATVFTALLYGGFEFALFKWRTRQQKNVQIATGVKPDGVIGEVDSKKIIKTVSNARGGRPG